MCPQGQYHSLKYIYGSNEKSVVIETETIFTKSAKRKETKKLSCLHCRGTKVYKEYETLHFHNDWSTIQLNIDRVLEGNVAFLQERPAT